MRSPAADRAACVVGLAVFTAVAAVGTVAAISDDIRVLDLSRDPATLSRSPAYEGLLTVLGGFAWSATVAVTLLGAWMLHRAGAASSQIRFLGSAAAVTTMLMIDDIFLVHEELGPSLGLSEEVLFGLYGGLVVAHLLGHRRVLGDAAWPILALSLLVFVSALLREVWFDFPEAVLPDTFAFVGTGLWMAFHVHTTVSWLERTVLHLHPSP